MKTAVVLGMLAFVFIGCTDREAEFRAEGLQNQNNTLQNLATHLTQELAARDEYVDKITGEINSLYTSVENVKARENSLLRETNEIESDKKLTRDEMRAKVIERIELIRSTLSDDHKRLLDLQSKLGASKRQYAGLQKMVDNLKNTIEERDRAIADLGQRIGGLQQEVTEQSTMINQKDSVIDTQYKQITTAYYIAGTRDQLEKMGIIRNEGGVLWGMLGSTTTLTSKFDDRDFKAINKNVLNTIRVDGKIDEIIPKRGEQLYQKTELNDDQSILTIAQPDDFWKNKYLVIITDKPNTNY